MYVPNEKLFSEKSISIDGDIDNREWTRFNNITVNHRNCSNFCHHNYYYQSSSKMVGAQCDKAKKSVRCRVKQLTFVVTSPFIPTTRTAHLHHHDMKQRSIYNFMGLGAVT